jgi:uncharacterized protein
MTADELTTNPPILAEVLRRLIEAFKPERIYLFGSKARGDDHRDSDFDLVILVSDDTPAELRRPERACKVLFGTNVDADVLIWTRKYFDERLDLKASLPATIMREGKLLYAA